ncbi:major facilitator superfamily domain-containing protein, partial [Paraphoma chrysanthemicola]
LFVTNLEIPIVTTSLVAITNDLGDVDNIGWVISSYLLGYVGVLVIFAKLSDILGRKLMMSISLFLFIVFSGGCGAAQSFVQLTILRAFQGIGGAGCFAVATAMMSDMVPPEKLAKYVANLSAVYALSLLVGPIIGGALSSNSTWRWVFLINVPIAAPALAILILAVPPNFPRHGQPGVQQRTFKTLLTTETRGRLDFLGAALLLLATLSLTAAFEEAGSQFAWKSAYVITLLVVSGVLWTALLLRERILTLRASVMEPVLPWRFFKNRAMLSLLLYDFPLSFDTNQSDISRNALFLGGPWFVAIFQLPQRFQVIHGSSGTMAGVQTMPFTFAAPLGSAIASILAKKGPAVYVVILSGVLQTIGFALLASVPVSTSVPARVYGFQVIAGFGCGINISTLLLLVPFVVQYRDKAVGMGAVSQLRIMGGAIVLAIATSVFNSYTGPLLAEYMARYSITRDAIYSAQGIARLTAPDQDAVRNILARGFNKQMIVLAAFAGAQIPTAFMLWRKEHIRV